MPGPCFLETLVTAILLLERNWVAAGKASGAEGTVCAQCPGLDTSCGEGRRFQCQQESATRRMPCQRSRLHIKQGGRSRPSQWWAGGPSPLSARSAGCLLYTSDAA